MKTVAATIVLIVVLAIIVWIRGDSHFGPLPRCLPFCSGDVPSQYDCAAIVVLLLALFGLRRLGRSKQDDKDNNES
jgi:hypothetical protein